MNLTEKAAYLKGLAEGLKVNADDDMGKLVLALIDTIDDIALTVAYEVECPACHETICLDEDMLCEGEIECPNCGTDLEFDFDDECDCCCDCCDEGEEE